ncbi:hypothetical protein AAT19DRAFT_9518 [Rhodotorula toruloides]|uniref:Uncharacterized protein n=1 Tax=Rhodotorula toruloides TaxID=5286 RepID=A0A2T0A2E3_RHOTO|nr:hypothetical protein AAT19DRAFT_9518 [Rhodotorula toruloides]
MPGRVISTQVSPTALILARRVEEKQVGRHGSAELRRSCSTVRAMLRSLLASKQPSKRCRRVRGDEDEGNLALWRRPPPRCRFQLACDRLDCSGQCYRPTQTPPDSLERRAPTLSSSLFTSPARPPSPSRTAARTGQDVQRTVSSTLSAASAAPAASALATTDFLPRSPRPPPPPSVQLIQHASALVVSPVPEGL